MRLKKANEKDMAPLIRMYKEAFPVHNVFELPAVKIYDYLKKFLGSIIVAEEDGEIAGAVVITHKKYPKWKLFNFKHLAVAKKYQGSGIGSALLKSAENIAGRGKIEVNVAESEDEGRAAGFYAKNGYKTEGKLESHYRKGETCYVMGKIL